jgi:dUTP pyrophosphatase
MNAGKLPYKRLREGAIGPRKAYRKDGAYDLFAATSGEVGHLVTVVDTGIAVAIPEGHVGQLWGRSGLGRRGATPIGFVIEDGGQLRLAGMIDFGYTGPIGVAVILVGSNDNVPYKAGEAIAQMCVVPIADLEPEDVGEGELPASDRGPRGWGSTTTDPAAILQAAIEEHIKNLFGINSEELHKLNVENAWFAPPPKPPRAPTLKFPSGPFEELLGQDLMGRWKGAVASATGGPPPQSVPDPYPLSHPAPPENRPVPRSGPEVGKIVQRIIEGNPDAPAQIDHSRDRRAGAPAPERPVDQSRADQWPDPPSESASPVVGLPGVMGNVNEMLRISRENAERAAAPKASVSATIPPEANPLLDYLRGIRSSMPEIGAAPPESENRAVPGNPTPAMMTERDLAEAQARFDAMKAGRGFDAESLRAEAEALRERFHAYQRAKIAEDSAVIKPGLIRQALASIILRLSKGEL